MRQHERVTLLGSTGSIGVQTLDIVRNHPDRFSIYALVAHSRWEELARQAVEFNARRVVIGDERYYNTLKTRLAGRCRHSSRDTQHTANGQVRTGKHNQAGAAPKWSRRFRAASRCPSSRT